MIALPLRAARSLVADLVEFGFVVKFDGIKRVRNVQFNSFRTCATGP